MSRVRRKLDAVLGSTPHNAILDVTVRHAGVKSLHVVSTARDPDLSYGGFVPSCKELSPIDRTCRMFSVAYFGRKLHALLLGISPIVRIGYSSNQI